eukprot:TRINITY_DN885_c0_g1_i1.p2 TRINITY_DN885_c0_g1~~TRINITY_DN885_c0_g1_i1.p2  ORF type:complete len:118 (+),score=1.61 TRINITY_DN885_c0_g1_i1:152-505(+)
MFLFWNKGERFTLTHSEIDNNEKLVGQLSEVSGQINSVDDGDGLALGTSDAVGIGVGDGIGDDVGFGVGDGIAVDVGVCVGGKHFENEPHCCSHLLGLDWQSEICSGVKVRSLQRKV